MVKCIETTNIRLVVLNHSLLLVIIYTLTNYIEYNFQPANKHDTKPIFTNILLYYKYYDKDYEKLN